ncbi:GDP-mannose transporter into the lumen of the Golgi, partial [Cladochytrium tenue]
FVIAHERFFDPGYEGEQFYGLVVALFISGVTAFGISFGTSWCVRVTSSTTYSMVGALNKLPIAVAGMIFFDDPVTVGAVLGVFIAFFAGIIYAYAKSSGNQPAHRHTALPTTDLSKDRIGGGGGSDGASIVIFDATDGSKERD